VLTRRRACRPLVAGMPGRGEGQQQRSQVSRRAAGWGAGGARLVGDHVICLRRRDRGGVGADTAKLSGQSPLLARPPGEC
jgi:hypothetical protein